MAFNLEAVIKLRDKFSKKMNAAEKATQRFAKNVDRLKKVGAVAAGAVASGYAAMSAAAIKSARTAEEAERIMAISTGASGEALAELMDSYRNVGKLVPDELTKVSDAMATLNTMTAATGSELEAMTKGILDASRMLGEDGSANAAAFGRALKQWQIPAEQGTEYLDKLFKATQDYGLGLGELSGHLTGYGAVLKNAGFEMDEAAHFFSILSKEGLSVSRIMPALNASFRKWAADGKDSRKELQKVITTIQQTEDSQKALAIATDIFGAQGAQRLMTAIRNGAIPALDELGSVFDNTSGLVEETNKQTMKISDRLAILRNRMSLALEPVGRSMLDIADKAIPYLERGFNYLVSGMNWLRDRGIAAFHSVKNAIIENFPELSSFSLSLSDVGDVLRNAFAAAQPYIEWFINDGIPQAVSVVRNLYDRAVEVYKYIADNWTKFAPIVYGIVGAFAAYKAISLIVAAAIAIKTAAVTAFGAAVALATSPIFLIAAAIGVLIGIGVALYRNWDTIKAKAVELWGKVTELWNSLGNLRYGFLMLLGPIGAVIGIGIAIWKNWDTIKEKATELWSWLKSAFLGIRDGISDAMTSVAKRLSAIWDGIKETVKNTVMSIVDFVKSIPSRIGNAISRVKDVFLNVGKNIISGISDGFTSMLEKLPKSVRWAIDKVTSGISSAKDLGSSLVNVFRRGGDDVDGSHYHGIDRVPYDGYVARLHKDERVLTADEARAQDRSAGSVAEITITGNTFIVRQDSDIDAIADALFNRIKASWEAGA